MIPTTIPHGRTARRLEWSFLPPHLRAEVERRCGSPVVAADSRQAGFTPGFASVLHCADGSRHFVKAASVKAQRAFAEAYREEARKLAALPDTVPAPRLLWTHDADDWVVLGIEHVESRAPQRPWTAADLEATLDALEVVAESLTPPPAALRLPPMSEEFADWPGLWDRLRDSPPDLPHLAERLEDAAALAARFPEVCGGSTLVHTDVRDDNVLVDDTGRVQLCDWNWPVLGADWVDTVMALIGPRGDGVDVDGVLGRRRLVKDVPPAHIDVALALLAGYFLLQCQQPVPPTSPHLREAQRWQGEVVWHWLCERRGWL
ncbi:phosphotransferase family protein [Nocardioides ferulae]|uniref:phosphotransferase family protein n=1 Tax=Nocardioides ferulae TaxID=2340821 RepID=UPI001F0BA39B|nr:phosphotransferase [Nocardioides ferulae]